MASGRGTRTVVALHAHPDDEALLTGGSLALAARAGHRVVVVVATAGEAGLAAQAVHDRGPLAGVRLSELAAAAAALGVARTELLGYADSGLDGSQGGERGFARTSVDAAAERVAAVLHEENADILIGYDAAGGYGHPDHRQVHRVAVRAAELAGTPRLLEATVDRDALLRAVRWARRLRLLSRVAVPDLTSAFTPAGQITLRVDVRGALGAKAAALRAHASQATADGADRTLAMLLRLPRPIFRRVLGTEWYVEPSRVSSNPRREPLEPFG
ncbi:MAG TPA: PIG-L family deacetylase [Nocardioidaceae bacterium]|nr:PIG-L family deacetylase [Nocardioidaceae bacterium]